MKSKKSITFGVLNICGSIAATLLAILCILNAIRSFRK